jgi:hypothetical protein
MIGAVAVAAIAAFVVQVGTNCAAATSPTRGIQKAGIHLKRAPAAADVSARRRYWHRHHYADRPNYQPYYEARPYYYHPYPYYAPLPFGLGFGYGP